MKKFFEIFIVVFVLFLIIYIIFYNLYFDGICDKFSGTDISNINTSITKLAKCKDSLICESSDILINNSNIASNWVCVKKESPIFTKEFYFGIGNNILNSITK